MLYATNLVEQLFHWREIKVSLQQRRDRTEQFVGVFEQLPRPGSSTGATVRVDSEVLVLDEMTGQVEIANALRRHRMEEFMCVVAVIDAVHDDVVDVEHQVAVRLLQHGKQKLAFRHRRIERCVVADVFERHALLENVLYATHTTGDILDGLFGERDRHQVVELTVVTAVTQVFRVHADLVLGHEVLDIPDQLFVQWGGSPDR